MMAGSFPSLASLLPELEFINKRDRTGKFFKSVPLVLLGHGVNSSATQFRLRLGQNGTASVIGSVREHS